MRGIHLFMFIVMIPALAALGHDIYLFVQNDTVNDALAATQAGDRPWTSFFAALGYIWTQYEPESYKTVSSGLDSEAWAVVKSILAQKAVFVGIIFGLFWWAVAFLFKSLNLFGFGRGSSSNAGGKTPKGEFKYKRK